MLNQIILYYYESKFVEFIQMSWHLSFLFFFSKIINKGSEQICKWRGSIELQIQSKAKEKKKTTSNQQKKKSQNSWHLDTRRIRPGLPLNVTILHFHANRHPTHRESKSNSLHTILLFFLSSNHFHHCIGHGKTI